MNTKIISTTGIKLNDVKFPIQFSEEVRPDLIKRAVLVIQSNNKQPYGISPIAGKQHVTKLSRRRHKYKTSYGHGISRIPRKIMSRNGTRFNWVGALSPGTVGGRRAHGPKAEKVIEQKINKKEKRKAIRSAMAASIVKSLVEERGHKVNDYPLVIEDKAEIISKSKDVKTMLEKLGLNDELDRCEKRSIRAGKGTMRGRKYKTKKGPLLVVSKTCSLLTSAKNIPGVDVIVVDKLNAESLAPGADYGRLTIYTESSLKRISEENLFTNNIIKKEVTKK